MTVPHKTPLLPLPKFLTSKFDKHSNANPNAPQLMNQPLGKKFFLPTFNDRYAILFWLGLVVFYVFLSVVLQIGHFNDIQAVFKEIIETFVMAMSVVGSILLYVHFSIPKFDRYNYNSGQITREVLLAGLFITPIMTLVARWILQATLDYDLALWELVAQVVLNTFLSLLMIGLLSVYFRIQYNHIVSVQSLYRRKLIEQNEQLKARITPHFFFNMLNTMQYLVEDDPIEAENMIRCVSALYRASFEEIREMALLDEIELCEDYLTIEKYRFSNKLKISWVLPDEDLLYDMVIASLTLQLVIEKMIVNVVEMTTEAINLKIAIHWENDMVAIDVITSIPNSNLQVIYDNIQQKLMFNNQLEVLRQFYGEKSSIGYVYTEQGLVTQIRYPLKDVAF
ncbi:sensor histidine kinase [Moraxella sp. TY5]|uniref:sensor histidine kinase n=1 Tax=Moraxella sp. TY5 TaxID=3387627 RepID=UPI003AF93E03